MGMLTVTACSHSGDVAIPADTLVSVGDDVLRRSELQRNMPSGLGEADSTAFARAYIRSWIDARLIENVAIDEVDRAEIERLTAQYRNELIMAQYRRAMAHQASDGIFAEDSLHAYYDSHSDDYRLERPMLRGVYLKVVDGDPHLHALRKLYNSTRPVDIDRLDKVAMGTAVHYDYFRDRWVDIEQIETRIPAELSPEKLKAGKGIDVSVGGFTYLLSVDDYLETGAIMPFESARPIIKEQLLARRRIEYDTRLRNELLTTAINDGYVSFPYQNPLK